MRDAYDSLARALAVARSPDERAELAAHYEAGSGVQTSSSCSTSSRVNT
jgi:hypothetical protein